MTGFQDLSWRILLIGAGRKNHQIVQSLPGEIEGHTITLDRAASFETGLRKLGARPYQAILVQDDLGSHTGIDLIREAAARGSAAPCILLAEHGSLAADLDAMRAGAAFYLAKDELTPALLERAIRYAARHKAAEVELHAQSEAHSQGERDQLFAQLEQERARWKGVVEGIADEVWICDTQGQMSMMNLPAITAMRLKEFKDHTLEEVTEDVEIYELNGEVRAPDQWPLLRSLRGEIVRGEEIMRSRQTGHTRYRQYSSAPLRDAAGNITGSVAIVRDVTEYKRLEEIERQNEAQLRAIFEAMSDAVVVFNRRGRAIRANPAAKEFFGFDPTDLELWEKYYPSLSVTRPDGSPFLPEEHIGKLVERGETFAGERLRFSGLSGRPMEILASASPLLDERQVFNGIVIALHDISELAGVQQSLTNQRQRLGDILESIQDGFMEVNWDWRFTYLNRRAAQGSGLLPNELIGKNLWETFPSLLGTPTESLYRGVMERRQPETLEVEGVLSSSWFEIRVYPSPEGITIFWSDITRRKQLEAEQRKLLVAVEQSPNPIMITELSGRIEYVNPRFSELSGYSFEEVIGKNPSFQKSGYTSPEEYAELWNTIRSGKVWHGIFRNKKRSGELYWESALIAPVRDENNQITHFLAVKEDISERKRAEEALERSEARLRRLFESSVIGIMNREPTGRILHANDSLLKMLGYTRQDLETCPLHMKDLLPEEYLSIEPHILREVLEEGVSRPREKEYIRKDGTRVPVLVGLTRLDGPPVEISTFVIDMTELKTAQAALEDQAEKLKRSNQDLEQFAFVVSHDLQEPLRKITFFSESIQKKMGVSLGEETLDALGRMQNAAWRMREMIRDLLDLSRVSTRGEAFQEVDLSLVVQDVISDLEGRIRKENGQVQVDSALPTIQADRSQMQRLLQNLIGNALKYHKKDVPPRVKITARETPSNDRQGKGVTLTIEDNGIGFDEQYAERIFQPFQRLHGRGEYDGTGMGLTICRKIVDRHHGQITARGLPGQGATFIVHLPVRQPE